jgi:hypothetical protein
MSDIQYGIKVWQIKTPEDGLLGPKHVVKGKVKGKE